MANFEQIAQVALSPVQKKNSAKSPDYYGKDAETGVVVSGWKRQGKYGSFLSIAVSKPVDGVATTAKVDDF